jgi:hypothetical protein
MPPKPTPQITPTSLPPGLPPTIHHLTRTLSTATGLDAFLATASYTSLFLHTQLTPSFPRASPNLSGSPALKALSTLLEDHRLFSRLFGLFPLYAAILDAWRKPHRDPIVKTLLYASLAAGTLFQVMENAALLVGKGVLKGVGREEWLWAVGHRFWAVQLGCELMRLARVRQLRFREELGAEKVGEEDEKEAVWGKGDVADQTKELLEVSTEKLVRVQSAELEKRWWRQLYVTAASIPLAVHWSFEDISKSPVSEAVFAGCGMVAGIIGWQDAWEETA